MRTFSFFKRIKPMGSNGSSSELGPPWMPALAILRHELRSLWSGWLVRLWLAGTAVLTLLVVAGNWQQLPTAPLIGALHFQYLFFPWVLVVMVLGVMPVTGQRVEAVADGLLSRPVTRYEFLLASWAARVLTVCAVYLAVMVPAVVLVSLADRPVREDRVTLFGVVTALGVVGVVLTFLTSLGFLGHGDEKAAGAAGDPGLSVVSDQHDHERLFFRGDIAAQFEPVDGHAVAQAATVGRGRFGGGSGGVGRGVVQLDGPLCAGLG
ncbi:MAG TPA: hypothetical protein EYP56_22895 [Planctomycetaceae bacterium]|nr:hypothetical protein [Planctomycetaceae bacterium]